MGNESQQNRSPFGRFSLKNPVLEYEQIDSNLKRQTQKAQDIQKMESVIDKEYGSGRESEQKRKWKEKVVRLFITQQQDKLKKQLQVSLGSNVKADLWKNREPLLISKQEVNADFQNLQFEELKKQEMTTRQLHDKIFEQQILIDKKESDIVNLQQQLQEREDLIEQYQQQMQLYDEVANQKDQSKIQYNLLQQNFNILEKSQQKESERMLRNNEADFCSQCLSCKTPLREAKSHFSIQEQRSTKQDEDNQYQLQSDQMQQQYENLFTQMNEQIQQLQDQIELKENELIQYKKHTQDQDQQQVELNSQIEIQQLKYKKLQQLLEDERDKNDLLIQQTEDFSIQQILEQQKNSFMEQIYQYEEESQNNQQKNQMLIQQIEQKTKQIESLLNKCKNMQTEIENQSIILEKEKKKSSKIVDQLTYLENENKELKEQISQTEMQKAEEIKSQERKLQNLSSENKALKTEIQNLNKFINQQNEAKNQSEIDEEHQQQQAEKTQLLISEIEILKDQLDQKRKKNRYLKAKIEEEEKK